MENNGSLSVMLGIMFVLGQLGGGGGQLMGKQMSLETYLFYANLMMDEIDKKYLEIIERFLNLLIYNP